MAIKNKDGSVFKLTAPNPLMKSQDNWDVENVKLINFEWEVDVIHDERNPVEKFKTDYNIPDIGEILKSSKNNEVLEPEKQPEHIIEEVPEPTTPMAGFDKKTMDFLDKHKVIFLCVVAKEVKVNDDLYGDSYTRTTYGEKVQFPAIIINQSDLALEFWAMKDVPENSIVYPQDRTKRWWRVKSSYSKSGGYVISGIISDVNPDFS